MAAPEVECIGKGKAHKKYEFGCKVSVCVTHNSNWILGCDAFHNNPYDGHTLQSVLKKASDMTGIAIKEAYVDNGYRGHLKSDNRMKRNYLKGIQGDKVNAICAAAGYNIRKMLKAFCFALIYWLHLWQKIQKNIQPKPNMALAR